MLRKRAHSPIQSLCPPSVPSYRTLRKANFQGFTLIELLAVIAIIGILAGITFGIVKGVNERAAIGQTKAELAALSVALESYKRQYGDYPRTGNITLAKASDTPNLGKINLTYSQAQFYLALTGRKGPKMDTITGRNFVDLNKFTLEENTYQEDESNPDSPKLTANAFLDPWGRRYIYIYKEANDSGTWRNPTYILLSAGPDGYVKGSIGNDGALTKTFLEDNETSGANNGKGNSDNIYANE